MNKLAVASELVKIAKTLTADHGDVACYFNIFDMVENPKDLSDKDQEIIRNLVMDSFNYKKWKKDVLDYLIKNNHKISKEVVFKKG